MWVETTALSFALSLLSMLILYVVGSGIRSLFEWKLTVVPQATVIGWLSTVPSAIAIYVLLVIVSLIVGALLGCVGFGLNHFDPTLPWAQFHQLAEESGENETYIVRVKTSSGDELLGQVEDEGEAALNKDIILENPRRLRFSQDGEIADDRRWTGYTYIHSQGVSYVEFDRLEDADATEAKGTDHSSTKDDTDDEIDQLERLSEGQDNDENKDD